MQRFSKPLGNLLDFKQDFFKANDVKLDAFKEIADVYRAQPMRTACKNCDGPMSFADTDTFTRFDIRYAFCPKCGHCNGAHEDTAAFCEKLYTEDAGQSYAGNYTAKDVDAYQSRVREIYRPKAKFLRDALAEVGCGSARLCDFGAGAGHFVAAASEVGFDQVVGYEPSQTLVRFGNEMMGRDALVHHDLGDILRLIAESDAEVVSFVGVIEHLGCPREALRAIRDNPRIRYLFFSVPLFSPTVVIESAFPDVMPRQLVAGHTHLYTPDSIEHFCGEFGFESLSEWWFGLDMIDLYRSITVMLAKHGADPNKVLRDYWDDRFLPLADGLQNRVDTAKLCSEVHMLVRCDC